MRVSDHILPINHCDLCGEHVERSSYVVVRGEQDLLGTNISLTTKMCRRCRFVFQGERFSEELLIALYAQDRSFAFGEHDGNRRIVGVHLAERRRVISNAMMEHGLRNGARVLDIGGGAGECCSHLAHEHEVVVADAASSEVVDSRIQKVDGLFSGQLEPASFDVAVLNHVLEHVFSPTEMLAAARRMLRPGGIAVIEVPFEMFTPLLARHLGDWRHVVYFSRATLGLMLRKVGLEVEQLNLVNGCYGVRRLPVIRALAVNRGERTDTGLVPPQSFFALFHDMLSPVTLRYLAMRVLRGHP